MYLLSISKISCQARLANIRDNITDDNTERVRYITEDRNKFNMVGNKDRFSSQRRSQSRNRKIAQNKSKKYRVGSTSICSS